MIGIDLFIGFEIDLFEFLKYLIFIHPVVLIIFVFILLIFCILLFLLPSFIVVFSVRFQRLLFFIFEFHMIFLKFVFVLLIALLLIHGHKIIIGWVLVLLGMVEFKKGFFVSMLGCVHNCLFSFVVHLILFITFALLLLLFLQILFLFF